MDQRTLYQQSAAASGPGRDLSSALQARDQFVIDHIKKALGERGVLQIVELSIGDGRMTFAMLAALKGARLTCAEISELRIKQLREEIEGFASLVGRLPEFVSCNLDTDFGRFESDAYDAVVALDIMEHVLDVFGFVANCRRILKPGGRLYLRVPNIAYVKHRLNLLRGHLPVTASWFGPSADLAAWREWHGWDGGHLHLFTVPILFRLLTDEGFAIETCGDPGARFAGLRKVWPNLLFANPLIIAGKN